MIDRFKIILILGLASIVVVSGILKYNEIQYKRETAKREIRKSLLAINNLCRRFISKCNEVDIIIDNMKSLYQGYLLEVLNTQIHLEEANRKREAIINERHQKDSQISQMLKTLSITKTNLKNNLLENEASIYKNEDLKYSEKENLLDYCNQLKEKINVLQKRLDMLEHIKIENDILISDMVSNADKILSAIQEAKTTEEQISKLIEKFNIF